jgi:hypothetical protein
MALHYAEPTPSFLGTRITQFQCFAQVIYKREIKNDRIID